jgi:hypothetical protein
MDNVFKYERTLSIVDMVKISSVIELVKVFWASHSSTVDVW